MNVQKKEEIDKIKSSYDFKKLSNLEDKYEKSYDDEKQKANDEKVFISFQ